MNFFENSIQFRYLYIHQKHYRIENDVPQYILLNLLCLENIIIIYLFSISASVFSVVPVVSLLFCCLLCAMCSFSGQRSAVVKV